MAPEAATKMVSEAATRLGIDPTEAAPPQARVLREQEIEALAPAVLMAPAPEAAEAFASLPAPVREALAATLRSCLERLRRARDDEGEELLGLPPDDVAMWKGLLRGCWAPTPPEWKAMFR